MAIHPHPSAHFVTQIVFVLLLSQSHNSSDRRLARLPIDAFLHIEPAWMHSNHAILAHCSPRSSMLAWWKPRRHRLHTHLTRAKLSLLWTSSTRGGCPAFDVSSRNPVEEHDRTQSTTFGHHFVRYPLYATA
jgi:hypothetical protein